MTMMMRSFVFLVLFVARVQYSEAQRSLPANKYIFEIKPGEFWFKQRWADSVYLFHEFTEGTIELSSGVVPSNRPLLNYNIFLETMYIKEGEDALVPLTETGFSTIHVGNRKFIYTRKHGVLEVILDGKVTVAQRTYMAGSYTPEYRAARIDNRAWTNHNSRYYWFEREYYIFGERSHIMRPSTPALSKLFPGRKSEIKTFVKDHNTDLKKREDLLDLVDHFNHL